MVTYNDSRFTYNNEWLTYNWLQFLELDDTQASLEEKLGSINFSKSDNQTQSEFISLLRVLSFLVSDNVITSENKTLNIVWLNIDTILMNEFKLLNIDSYHSETSVNSENVLTMRLMVISVNDEQSVDDNIVFNVWIYNAEIQSLTDLSLNNIELVSEETISTSELKRIDTILKNVETSLINESFLSEITSSYGDNQITLEALLNKLIVDKTDTVTSSDIKIIEILLKNADIIYTTDNWDAIRLLLSKIKPNIVGINKLVPKAQ